MTIANAPDIIPALPELFLAIIIMALMMMGVFHENGGIQDIKASRLISLLSVISLLLAVMLVSTLSGGRLVTFAGMFVSDTFAVYCKVLVLIGSALTPIIALGETLAHLHCLMGQGKVRRRLGADGVHLFQRQ